MNVLIVYDSAFGNTAKIANALADAVTKPHHAMVKLAQKATPADAADADLIIVGSPTQGGRPTKAIQSYIQNLPLSWINGKSVAAFDTRFSKREHGFWLGLLIRVIGFAAPRIAAGLQTKGGMLVLSPAGFIVSDKEGPLKKYELKRAADWMRKVQAAA